MNPFDEIMNLGNEYLKIVGSEIPDKKIRTVEYKCEDCGYIRYYGESTETYKIIKALPDHWCTKGDGKQHRMRKVEKN